MGTKLETESKFKKSKKKNTARGTAPVFVPVISRPLFYVAWNYFGAKRPGCPFIQKRKRRNDEEITDSFV